jgi:YD repeat-containing protein
LPPARVLGLPETTRVLDASGQVVSETRNVYPAVVTGRQHFRPVRTESLIEAGRWAVSEFVYDLYTFTGNPDNGPAVRLVKVMTKNNGVVRNTVRFDYDPVSGLLQTLRAYTGNESALKLYMCLDHDPYTGLLRRRMDRNGDRDGDLQFDSGDDYIEFTYDGFNRLADVARWHGGEGEPLSSYAYSNASDRWWVLRRDHLDGEASRWTRVRNDALGRAAETWTTLTGEQAAYTVKTFDVLGRVVTESNPVAVAVNPDAGTWNTGSSGHQTATTYDALGRVASKTAPDGFTVATTFGRGTARDVATGAATIPAITERVTEQVGGEERWRQLYRDAFGRIVQVDECLLDGTAGEWRTLYGYDAADRLRQVDKRDAAGAPGQRRRFDYNAAGWLTAVQLPEYADQQMRYAYDDLGNVTAKTLVSAVYGSLLGYAETLVYDTLSRLTARTVTLLGTTTWHTFTYDGGAVADPPPGHPGDLAWGRLTHDRTAYGDAPGAVAVERFVRYNWQGLPEEKAERFGTLVAVGADTFRVAGEAFATAYEAYDRQGNLRGMRYPSG